MLLRSIKLMNFRQYREAQFDFASGSDNKNVTFIYGDNGTGKSTLSAAIMWCLYADKKELKYELLNLHVAEELMKDEEAEVNVTLMFEHNLTEYTLTRTINYRKNSSGELLHGKMEHKLYKKDRFGSMKQIEDKYVDSTINEILPKALSDYFFFDGEQVEKLGKTISTARKSKEFEQAVEALLGLDAQVAAMDILNPSRQGTVTRKYSNKLIGNVDSELGECQKKINEYNDKIAIAEKQLTKYNEQKEANEKIIDDCNGKLELYDSTKEQQAKVNEKNVEQKGYEYQKRSNFNEIISEFNNQCFSLFARNPLERASQKLIDCDLNDIDIPNITGETIEYLLKNNKCICGEKIEEGSEHYNTLMALIDKLPPKSMSNCVRDFKREAFKALKEEPQYKEKLVNHIKTVESLNIKIEECEDEIIRLNKIIGESDETVIQIAIDQRERAKATLKGLKETIREIETNKIAHEKLRQTYIKKKEDLDITDERNKKIYSCQKICEDLYEMICAEYHDSAKIVKKELETTLNEIYSELSVDKFIFEVDEKYHIQTFDKVYKKPIALSDGENKVLVFAFILSLVEMAQRRVKDANESDESLVEDPYPLVMDAPFSKFDKDKIGNVCDALIRTGQQTIIFIKDTDGDVAFNKLKDHIGLAYELDFENYCTRIVKKEKF